jgi:hypothetical protein
MKKNILLAIVTFMMVLSVNAVFAGPKINISFEFGKRSCDCCGFGLCNFYAIINWNANNPDNSTALSDNAANGSIIAESNKLTLTFYKVSMSALTIKKYFGSGYFIVEENLILSNDLCSKLEISNYTIKKGRYPIVETADAFIVKL